MLNLLLPHPAALIKAEKTKKTKTLLIADPHIGWEIALQKKASMYQAKRQKFSTN